MDYKDYFGLYTDYYRDPFPPKHQRVGYRYWEDGKENGNYYNVGVIWGLYGDNGKEHGSCYIILGYVLGLYEL